MASVERRRAERDIPYRAMGFVTASIGAGVAFTTFASSPSWVAMSTSAGWSWIVFTFTVSFLTIFLVWLAWVGLRRIVAPLPCVCGHPWEAHGVRVLTVPCRDCSCWTYLGTRRSQAASSL